MFASLQVEAFWWLFGKSVNQVNLSYLYINGISYDESGENITLYQDLLKEGLVNIRGRARINKGRIGSVRVSIDGKESWEQAELSEDGAFQYYFRPQIGEEYEIYIEAMETAGRTNDIEETYKVVTVSQKNYQSVIAERIAEMFNAYMQRDATKFMEYVSWDFIGDDVVLEQALYQDFNNFADIDIRYNIVNQVVSDEGRFTTVLEYDRRLIATNDAQTLSDSGLTKFSFKLEDNGPMLYSMSHPLIFGLSDADNLGSGVINSAENAEIIAVDDSGNIALKDISEIVSNNPEDNSPGEIYESGTITLENKNGNQGYSFSDGAILAVSGPSPTNVDFYTGEGLIWLPVEVGFYYLNESNIDNVTEVPAADSGEYIPGDTLMVGECYALLLRDNTYVVISYEEEELIQEGDDSYLRSEFRYKYRDDGGREF